MKTITYLKKRDRLGLPAGAVRDALMNGSKIKTNPAPKILERTVLVIIGVLALIFVPFCFLASLAFLTSVFGLVTSKYQISVYYSLPLALLFAFLGLLLAVAGWRFLRNKQAEDLFAPFRIWFRRIAWLFVYIFAIDGLMSLVHGNSQWLAKLVVAAILIIIIRKGHALKQYFEFSRSVKEKNEERDGNRSS